MEEINMKNNWKPTKHQIYILDWVANILLHSDGIVEKEVSKTLNEICDGIKKL